MKQRMMRTRKKTSDDCFVHNYRITDRENLGFRVYMKKKKQRETNETPGKMMFPPISPIGLTNFILYT